VLQKLQTPRNDPLLQFQNNGSSSCFTPDGVRCRCVLTLLVRFLPGYPDISDNVYYNYQTPGLQGKVKIILYLLIIYFYYLLTYSLFTHYLFTTYLLFTYYLLFIICIFNYYLFIIYLFITYLFFVYCLLIVE